MFLSPLHFPFLQVSTVFAWETRGTGLLKKKKKQPKNQPTSHDSFERGELSLGLVPEVQSKACQRLP